MYLHGQQYNSTLLLFIFFNCGTGGEYTFLKKNLNAFKLDLVSITQRGKNVKTFRWDNRLLKQNLVAFKPVLRWYRNIVVQSTRKRNG